MSQTSIYEVSPGVIALSGVLDYLSAPALREQGRRLLASNTAEQLVVDCARVDKSSSVGVALLLAFMRDADKAGKSLVLRSLPKDMQEIARVSGLLEILPLSH